MMTAVIGVVAIGLIGYGFYSSRKLSKEIDQTSKQLKEADERLKRDKQRTIEMANFNPVTPEMQERMDKIFEEFPFKNEDLRETVSRIKQITRETE